MAAGEFQLNNEIDLESKSLSVTLTMKLADCCKNPSGSLMPIRGKIRPLCDFGPIKVVAS